MFLEVAPRIVGEMIPLDSEGGASGGQIDDGGGGVGPTPDDVAIRYLREAATLV